MRKDFVIGLDAGRSAIKTVVIPVDNPSESFQDISPNAVMAAIALVDDAANGRAIVDTVTFDGDRYFVGKTAERQLGQQMQPPGMSDDYFFGREHAMLVCGALKRAQAKNSEINFSNCQVVVGLPVGVFATRREEYLNTISSALKKLDLPISGMSLREQAQPYGPLLAEMFDGKGGEKKTIDPSTQAWGVIEIGHYTTDTLIVQEGDILNKTFKSCQGVAVAADAIQQELGRRGMNKSHRNVTKVLETGTAMHGGDEVDAEDVRQIGVRALVAEVHQNLLPIYNDYRDVLKGVLVAGGGAPLLQSFLKERLPKARIMENPRYAVATGFARFGLMQQLTSK